MVDKEVKDKTEAALRAIEEGHLFEAVRGRLEDPAWLFHGGMGIHVVAVEEGHVEAEVVLEKKHGNPIGSIHGGLLLTLADDTGGAACSTLGHFVTTSSSSMNFLRTNPDAEKVIARANVIKSGRRLCVAEIKLYDNEETLLATGTYEYAVLN